jgi:hypothetical protein
MRSRNRDLASDFFPTRGWSLRWLLGALVVVVLTVGWITYRSRDLAETPLEAAHEAILMRTGEYPTQSRLAEGGPGPAVCGAAPSGRFIYQVRRRRLVWEQDDPAAFALQHADWCRD